MSTSVKNTEGICQSCCFPPLLDELEAPGKNEVLSSLIDLSPVRDHIDSSQSPQKIREAIESAWALTLYCYVGSEEVCYDYRDAEIEETRYHVLRTETSSAKTLARRTPLSTEISHNTSICFQADQQQGFEKYDYAVQLTVDLSVGPDRREVVSNVCLHYSTDFLVDESATNVGTTFVKALSLLLRESHTAIKDLDLLSKRDYDRISAWNKDQPEAIGKFVHEIITEKSLSQPNAVAICAWDGQLTYKELEDMATRLAHHLVSLHVGPEVYVITCFPKTLWMVVTMVAILKAGGVCVPIDASQPASRRESIIQGVRSTIAIADSMYAALFDGIIPTVITNLASIVSTLPEKRNPVCLELCHENAAFVVYTSGSTGNPKGIIQHHEALSASAWTLGAAQQIDTTSRVLQFATWTFDASAGDILATLMRGGCVCIPSDQDRISDLSGFIRRFSVTHACLTPTIASLLRPADVPTLQRVSLGGEPLTQDNLSVWADRVNLINIFGVSECTNWCSTSARLSSTSSPSNIGRMFCGLYWIVDTKNHNRLLPIGSIGELLIQGPNVTRGYLNEPIKTAQAFVEDPAFIKGRKSSWRLYRTGDLARYNSDGTIHFLGRRDKQVKLNGQRIDLAGIEHQIKAQLGNEAHVVVELIQRSGIKLLTAFICLIDQSNHREHHEDSLLPMTNERQSLAKNIVSTLSTSLPPYMVPSAYIFLSRMPMTSSAKMDRKQLALQASELCNEHFMPYTLVDRNEKQEPSTAMEQKLQALWSRALGVPLNSIGAKDGFFRLGGDSISAMRLVAYARDAGIHLTVANVFRDQNLDVIASTATKLDPNVAIEVSPFSLVGKIEEVSSLEARATSLCSPESVDDIYPCTPLQEGLMALTVSDAEAYVGRFIFKVHPSIDLGHFRSAWNQVVERTAILRTRIIQSETGKLYQAVTQETPCWKDVTDLDLYLKEDSKIPITLGGPLSRYAIVHEKDETCYFVWTIHHAIYDGWSFPLVISRVSSVYNSNLVPAIQPFNTFIKYLQEIDAAAADKYWTDTLSGATQPTFPAMAARDYTCPTNESLSISFPIQKKASSGVTMATVVRTAWAMIVSRYSDSDDVVFGATAIGRNVPVQDIAEIIGPTIATIPVRVVLNRQQPVMSLLRTVQEQAIESLPFEQVGLQNIKRLSPDAQAACEFQNLLVVQNSESMDIGDNSIGLERLDLDDGMFHPYALVLECTVRKDCLDIRTQHDSNVVSTAQVQRILYQFGHVVKQLSNPVEDQIVADLELLSPEDRTQLLTWNHELPGAANVCAHHAIRNRMISQPEALAVSAWDADFTYQELDRVSTKIANSLINLGIGPETFVALCFEKSAWAVVAMLAVMKSGGAFVPLDPSHPMNRRQDIIDQVKAKVLLTSTLQAESQDWGTTPVVVANSDWLDMPETPLVAHSSDVQPSNTMYVIFTSGSTGTPKGFVIEHSAFCSAALGQGRGTFMNSESRIFQFSSYSFDVSILEIVTGLIFGGCICISSSEASKDIAKAMRDMRVTWTCLTPSVVRLVQPESVPDLKTLVLGGEAVWKTDIKAWSDKVQLILGYGPSECSVAATVSKVLTPQSDPDNFGHPVASLCWIVEPDDHNKLAPLGTVGEILIEGPLLGRCYLNDKVKTSLAFIDGPKWLQQAALTRNSSTNKVLRVYKSGDLGRFNPDGSINFVARKDRQVKVRGQRVELQEVEYHFSKVPEVRHIAVDFPKHGPFKKKLVLVLSLREVPLSEGEDSQLSLLDGELKQIAATRVSEICDVVSGALPPYMIPTVRIVVKDMPFTPSGKINRRRILSWLEDLDDASYRQIVGFDEEESDDGPANPLERSLRNIWSTILNLKPDQIGLRKPFFRLGGDSISAMQVMSMCRDEGIMVSVQDVIRCQTISKLAQNVGLNAQPKLVVLDEKFDIEFPLAPAQRLFFENAGPHVDARCNMSFYLKLTKLALVEDLTRALDKLVSQHSMLRARFNRNKDDQWFQSVPAYTQGSYRIETHYVKMEEQLPLIFETSQNSLNIYNGPIFSADIIFANNEEQSLYLVAHHLVLDYVSWRIIILDLENYLDSAASELIRPLSFQTWCHLQADWYRDQVEPIAAPFEHLLKPTNHEYWGMGGGQANMQADVAEHRFSLDLRTSQLLLTDCNQPLGTDVVDTTIAALVFSFARTFPDREVPTIFNEGHGREPWSPELDLSRTVGWYTTFYPIDVPVDTESIEDCIATLYRAKDSRYPAQKNALAYFTSQFSNKKDSSYAKHHFSPEIVLNYGGLFQQLERKGGRFEQANVSRDMLVPDFAPTLPRLSLFNVEVEVEHGSLTVALTFNRHMRHTDRLLTWMEQFEMTLQEFSRRLPSMNKHFTICDFPLLHLDYSKLRTLFDTTLLERGWTEQDVEDVYPCSPLQQGLLVSQTRTSDEGLYQVSTTWEIKHRQGSTNVDVDRLEEAWQTVVARHGIMRTILLDGVAQEGIYAQVVLSKVQAAVSRKTFSSYDAWRSSRKDELSFDGSKPPHMLSIITTDDGRVFCELNISHTIIDGVSKEILLKDLRYAYDSAVTLGPGPLCRDFIEYIQTTPDSSTYWKEYLAGVDPCYFPTLIDSVDEPKELLLTELEIDTSLATMYNFCASHGITLSNLFQLVWALVLRCYTGSDDVCFGYMNSGRDTPIAGIQDMVGPLISMLVCRVPCEETSTALQVLEKIERDFAQSLPHQHCGLAQIQRGLGLQGEPLFNSGMSFRRETSTQQDDRSSIMFSNFDVKDPSEYDAVLAVDISGDSLSTVLNHWSSRLSKGHALNVMNTFNTLMSRLIECPDKTIGKLSGLSSQDHNQIQRWNAKPLDFVEDCIHTIVERQAIERPYSIAIHAWDGELTYSELNQLSYKLARHLQSLGVGSEVVVPLCFEKSVYVVVAMVAVLKAGGAIALLDASHPISRLEQIIAQVGAKMMLTSAQYSSKLSHCIDKTVHLDKTFLDNLPISTGIQTHVTHTNAAYIVFTSGSTGTPKGILIQHSAFVSGAKQQARISRISPSSRVLQFASFGFDVSIMEIFTSLMFGACVCIPSDYARNGNVADVINEMRITWTFLTPSVVKLVRPEEVPSLETLILGGEPLTKLNVETWAEKLQLMNGYGPSECSVAAAAHRYVTRNTNSANIGEAIGGRCWIVNPNNYHQLMPIGAVGELVVQGPILARGYLGDPEKTSAAFVEDAAWLKNQKWSRLYKTGDLMRYNSDGTLIFIGRKDTQIKLRGQRIELDEIEHHISSHSLIKHSMVALPHKGPCGKQIIAIISLLDLSSQSTASDPSEIELIAGHERDLAFSQGSKISDWMTGRVPSYMVPTVWVILKDLPLLPSGKLERTKLRRWLENMDQETYNKITEFEKQASNQPLTQVGKKLQSIWGEVLGVPATEIGPRRSFLNLGGDSIAAMQVVARCRAAQIDLSLQDILRCKTISQLASHIEGSEDGPLSDTELDLPLNLFPSQNLQLSMANQISSQSDGSCLYNKSLLMHLEKSYPISNIAEALDILVSQHPMLRARFTPNKADPDKWLQHVLPTSAGSYGFAIHVVSGLEDMVPLLEASGDSLDIEHGPVFSAGLFIVNVKELYLSFIASQLVIDSTSWVALMEDFQEILDQRESSLQEPFSFQPFTRSLSKFGPQATAVRVVEPFETIPADSSYWGITENWQDPAHSKLLSFELDLRSTSLLVGECNKILRTQTTDLILGCLVHAFEEVFEDRKSPNMFIARNSRNDTDVPMDISNVVGCFETMYPLAMEARAQEHIVDTIRMTKDTRRTFLGNSRPCFLYRLENSGIFETLGKLPTEIAYNDVELYHQKSRNLRSLKRVESIGDRPVNSRIPGLALFDIVAALPNGCLRLSFTWSRVIKHQKKIVRWVQRCHELALLAIEKLLQMRAEYTVTDFPLLSYSPEDLGQLVDERLLDIGIFDVGNVEDIYPCSPMQTELVRSQAKDCGYYEVETISEVISLDTSRPVDPQRLQYAWELVVDRHATLRTLFVESVSTKGRFDQVVLSHITPRTVLLTSEEDGQVLEAFMKQAPIKYREPLPPHRLTICQTSQGNVFCKLEISHAIVDGTSVPLILHDLNLAYHGNLSTGKKPLYSSYIQYLQSKPYRGFEYWKSSLSQMQSCHMPVSLKEKERAGEHRTVDIKRFQSAKIRAICGKHSVTTSTLFHLVWAMVLRRYAKTDSVTFGYLVSGRETPVPRIQDAVGLFFYTLVCHLNFKMESPLVQILEGLQHDYIEALPYQSCDMSEVYKALDIKGRAFNTLINFGKFLPAEGLGTGVEFHPLLLQDPMDYDIVVGIAEVGDSVQVSLRYWHPRVGDDHATAIGDTFHRVLTGILEADDLQTVGGFDSWLALKGGKEVQAAGKRALMQEANLSRAAPDLVE